MGCNGEMPERLRNSRPVASPAPPPPKYTPRPCNQPQTAKGESVEDSIVNAAITASLLGVLK